MTGAVARIVVCARSQLMSEAVAHLISQASDLHAVPTAPGDVASVLDREGAVLVVTDADVGPRLGPLPKVPTVVVGERVGDAAGGGETYRVRRATTGEELLGQIRAALARATPPARPRRDASRGRRATDAKPWLTNREAAVLSRLATGRRPEEIAEELGVSANTVRTHVQNLSAKLGARSRVDAVAKARELGLVERTAGDGAR